VTEIPSWGAVAVSALLVVVAVAIASWQRLGISREIVVAAVRALVQLVAVGAVLAWLFAHAGIGGALAWIVVMTLIAAAESRRRGRGIPQAYRIALLGIGVGTVATLGVLVVGGVISTEPQVLIPIGGMVVSGAMQAASLTLTSLRRSALENRPAVEAALSLGLSARAAFARETRAAVRTALVPTVDATRVVGLIALPGTMTGLIIAGVDPLQAIRYQIIVMYMLLAAWAVSALVTARAAERVMFDDAERLVRLPV
jgi:putative ABC transport system permease protein